MLCLIWFLPNKESFLSHQEFIVQYNITIAIYISAIIIYKNLTISKFVNIVQIEQIAVFEVCKSLHLVIVNFYYMYVRFKFV